MAKELICLKKVSKRFILEVGTEINVLENLNLSVVKGEIVALLGPSGSGKSTVLRIMSGLLEPTGGEVLVSEKPLKGANLEVAFVFQSFALFPWETVYQNIMLALSPLKLSAKKAKKEVQKVIDLVGLEGFEEAYPRELSGGMQQRVGIARALVMNRPLLFLDEPFSALDVLTADVLRGEILNIFLSKKTAIRSMVIVTHQIQEAVYMANRILVMGSHPGYIRKEVINDLSYPRNESSGAFQRMVSKIHALITETLMPDQHKKTGSGFRLAIQPREHPIEALPNIQIVEMIGLLEAVAAQEGSADIFALAQTTGKDFGRTLYLAKAAELLELAETPKQFVILTEQGRAFVAGDMNIRKRMLHELFDSLRIVQMTSHLLQGNESLRLPIEELTKKISEWLPNENPHEIVQTLVSWGRFAEYFGYNDNSKEVYLDIGEEING